MDRTLGITSARIDAYFDDKQLFSVIKESGFDCVDYFVTRHTTSSPYFLEDEASLIAYFSDLRAYADGIGIKIHQTHAPYPTQPHNGKDNDSMLRSLQNSIHASSILGAEYVVMHPQRSKLDQDPTLYDQHILKDASFYGSLLPYLEKHNITLAIENMYGRNKQNKIIPCTMSCAEHINRTLQILDNPHYCACLDIGHAHLLNNDSGVSFIKELGDNLKVLHLHDNTQIEDDHLAPTLGTIDWTAVFRTLSEINYNGICNLEAHGSTRGTSQEHIRNNLKNVHNVITKILNESNY